MSERELGRALLGLDAANLAGVPDAQQQTWRVLERDRRRLRTLTAVTLVTWLVAVGLVLTVLIGMGLLLPKHAKLLMDVSAGTVPPAVREAEQAAHTKAAAMLVVAVTGAVGVLAVAALCTVLLVRASRQATLRQVNASLVAISEQLKQLRAAPGGGAAP